MAMRELDVQERKRLKYLTDKSIEFTLIQPTRTGLGKCILDATGPVRNYLGGLGLHEFALQRQGIQNRKYLGAKLLGANSEVSSSASLYRPIAKNGDPRIWFSGLRDFAAPNDILAIIADGNDLHVINVTHCDLPALVEGDQGPIGELVARLAASAGAISDELLGKLRAIAARGPLCSVMEGRADTAIGRTVEDALGISMNSRREPDYKGIELKSRRQSAKGNRHTLFAKVPDWPISTLKSSAQILERFGYDVPPGRKLNCTVSTRGHNPQSLYLQMDRRLDRLNERSMRASLPFVVSWQMESLRKALLEKHAETFWITADSAVVDGREWFKLHSICHTREPIVSQLEVLLDQGEISVDHLIKRSARGKVSERGPLFKVTPRSFGLLFPPSRNYDLA